MLARLRQTPDRVIVLLLLAWTALAVAVIVRLSFAHVAWPDECIYLVGARNVAERGSLQTNFYLTYSLLILGHPHRDVHMPGYILALAPFVRLFGAGMKAAVALNAAALMGSVVCLYLIGRRLIEDRRPALAAAVLLPWLPPFAGYVTVVYPEIVVTFVFLAGLAWAVRGGGVVHAAGAGALFAIGALFRETALLTLPLYLLVIPRRALLRGFAPGALLTFLLVVAPLSRDRAVHPNAIYPSVLVEAQRSEHPIATFTGALADNLLANLRQAAAAAPLQSAEDAVLLFLFVLLGLSLLAWPALPDLARRWAIGTWLSIALLTAAVLVLYVVRERGGVWGGVRAYMSWAPILLLLAAARGARLPTPARVAAAALLLAACAGLDRWQLYRFMRYKGSDIEDQDRNAAYLSRYIDAARPRRIVSRSFRYGYTHYPVEVVWSVPRDRAELEALEKTVDFEFLSLHEKHPLRLQLIQNARYLRVNKDDRGAEFLIWRRLY